MAEVKKLNGYDIKDYQLDALQITANQGKFFKVNSDNSITVSDTITSDNAGDNVTITASGSTHDLPSGYTELEYIKNSGFCYIDTGFAPNQDTKVDIDFSLTALTKNVVFFGSSGDWTSASFGFYIGSTGKRYSNYNSDTIIDNYVSLATDTKYNYVQDKNQIYLNSSLKYTHNSQTFQSTGNLYLGYTGISGYDAFYLQGSIYHFSLYDNSTLIRNMYPARRDSDNAIGMYDLVNDIFYTNAGTGTFTAGPEISSTMTINALSGLTSTVTELNYCDGVTSNIQTQLDSKQAQVVIQFLEDTDT